MAIIAASVFLDLEEVRASQLVENERFSTKPHSVITIDSLQTLKVYFDPLRTQIMHELAHEPRTVHQIAESLGVPFTRLYYHIKMLEKHNLIRVVDVVQLAGAIEEKYYQVTARQFTIRRDLLTFDPVGKNDSLEYMLDGVFGASHRDIRKSVAQGRIDLEATAPHPKSLLARKFLLRLTDEQATNFQRDLEAVLLKYQSCATSTTNPYYSCLLALYRSSVPYESFDDSDCIETE